MREWSTARQHVQGLKATDPRGAERLDKDITAVSLDFSYASVYAVSFVVGYHFLALVAANFVFCAAYVFVILFLISCFNWNSLRGDISP